MFSPLLPLVSSVSPAVAVGVTSFFSGIIPQIPAIIRHYLTAIDIESQAKKPEYTKALMEKSASLAGGHVVQITFSNIPGFDAFAKVVDTAAAGFRAYHQWTRVQEASRRLIAVLRGEPTWDELRCAAFRDGSIVYKTSHFVRILPAINLLGVNVLKFLYYCADVKRSASEKPGDSTAFVLSNISDTLRLFHTQPQYVEWVAKTAGMDLNTIRETLPKLLRAIMPSKNETVTKQNV